MNKEYIKSPINFIGNKDRLLNLILPLLPQDCNNIVEPFCGTASVSLNSNISNIFLNDKNIYLYNLIRTLKEVDYDYILHVIKTNIDYFNLGKFDKIGFHDFRNEFNNLAYKLLNDENEEYRHEANIELLTLIYHSFNYMMVFNNQGKFSVPSGYGRSWFNPSLQNKLKLFCKAIKNENVKLYNKDYRDFLDMYISYMDKDLSDTVFFVDCPYLISDDAYSRTVYLKWTLEHEIELYKYLHYIDKIGGKFILTNQLKKGELVNEHLENFSTHFKTINTHETFTNCSYQHKRKNDVEIMVINY